MCLRAVKTKHYSCSAYLSSVSWAITLQWRRQKEEVRWALISLCEAAERHSVRSEALRVRGATGAETSAEGARVEAP